MEALFGTATVKGADLAYRFRGTWADRLLSRLGARDATKRAYEALEFRLNRGGVRVDLDGGTVTVPTTSRSAFASVRHLARTERPVLSDFASELRSDDVVYDVGAHVGLYTFVAADLLTDGSVFAFELLPENVNSLREAAPENVTVVERAVSDGVGTRSYDAETTDVGAPTAHITRAEGVGSVQTTTLDEFVRKGNHRPTVVKIDVEGAERAVLSGGADALSSPGCRAVYLEIHDDADHEPLADSLSEYGYDVATLHRRGEQPFLKASR